ncbi:MAG TPA: AAA family ATPase [Dehalococcoidia bacterium]|nr:AAA family ATPase [Dehalococcoidia bacterium]
MTSTFSQPIICPVLIGRDEALSGLREVLKQASVRGRVALISGEAGIGKSRLVTQFLDEAASQGSRTVLVRFFEHDTGLPYSGVVRLLAELVSRPETAALIGPFAHDLSLVSLEAAGLASRNDANSAIAEPGGESEKLRFLQALTATVGALSSAQPIVLAFEDVHWADASSLEALLHLARRSAPALLLCLTFRSDEVGPDFKPVLDELNRERVSAEIRLAGLGVTHVDGMLKACLRTEHSTRADVLHAVHQLTGGNPFFVEEVTRSILDRAGGITALDTLKLADIDLPSGVYESVRRRTRGLTPSALELLSLAAVTGVRFDFPLLREIASPKVENLLPLIKELIVAQLVVEESEDNFVFRHALTREAIRSELLRRERRELSLRIGQAIEKLHPADEDARLEDLSWHFHEAGDWQKAFAYSMKAGQRALALCTPGAAVTHLTRAIDAGERSASSSLAEAFRLRGTGHEAIGEFDAARADYERAASTSTASPRTRWRALLDLGLLWAARDYARSEPYYREALELARGLDDPSAVAHSLDRLGNWYSNIGDMASAQSMSEEALSIFREQGDEAGIAQTLDLLGITCTLDMRYDQAAAYYREAITRLEKLDDRRTLASALASIQIGTSSCQTDMVPPALTLKEGSDFGERALAIAREMGWKADESYALWQLAFSTAPQGHYLKALAYAREALAIAQEIGHTQWEAGGECAVGAILTDLLTTDEAQVHLQRAVALSQDMNSQLWLGQAHAMLIDAHLAARENAAALELFESIATDDLQAFGPRQAYTSGAYAVLTNGDVARALAMLERLEAEAERSGPGKSALRLLRLRGRVLVASGEVDSGLQMLQRARTLARGQGHLSHEWRASAELAHAQLVSGNRDAARTAANDTIELIDSLAGQIDDEAMNRNFLERAMEALPGSLRRRAPTSAGELLTAREQEIALMIVQGLTNRDIADRLVVSSRTVESHVANAMAKLGYSTRSQLAAWAVEHRAE